MWMSEGGMREAFADLEALAVQCHFRDCSHTVENRCAVRAALASGQLTQERYDRYVKLNKELAYLNEAHRQHGWTQRARRRNS
jgi:ribosome biogenesis GTPase / thiamine phosphate phosphatase